MATSSGKQEYDFRGLAAKHMIMLAIESCSLSKADPLLQLARRLG